MIDTTTDPGCRARTFVEQFNQWQCPRCHNCEACAI